MTPEADPDIMSVLEPRRTDEEESIYRIADRQSAAGMGSRRETGRALSPTRRNGDDAVSLEAEVRWVAGERGEAAARAGRRES